MAASDLELVLGGDPMPESPVEAAPQDEPYDGPVITLKGREFPVATEVGHLALMRFAKLAHAGTEADSMEGMAAMYDLIRQTVDPAAWPAFEAWADESRANGDELLDAAMEAVAGATGRGPTKPSGSSDGQPSTKASSVHASSSRVIHELEGRERPDLALFVVQADQARVLAGTG